MCLLDRGQGVCMSGPMQFKPVLYKGQPLSIPLYLSPGTSIVKFILQYKLSTQDSEAKVTLNNMDSNSQKVVSFSCPAPLPTHLSVTSRFRTEQSPFPGIQVPGLLLLQDLEHPAPQLPPLPGTQEPETPVSSYLRIQGSEPQSCYSNLESP